MTESGYVVHMGMRAMEGRRFVCICVLFSFELPGCFCKVKVVLYISGPLKSGGGGSRTSEWCFAAAWNESCRTFADTSTVSV